MSRPAATVSVDLDPVDLHLVAYGHPGQPPDPLSYTVALPRLLTLFARHRVRATVFVVGRDAEAQASAIRALIESGHEVASHSLTHPTSFAALPAEAMRRELSESRALLERASGARVIGFRAPNFDLDARAAGPLREAGYRYDASSYPTPLLVAARALLALKSSDRAAVLAMRLWPFSLERRPHPFPGTDGAVTEFPVSVRHGVPMPLYHTLRYGLSDRAFDGALETFADREVPLSYPLHAVDVLGLAEDGVDPRLAPHPGMRVPLERKLELLDRTLAAIAARFEIRTFAQRVGDAGR